MEEKRTPIKIAEGILDNIFSTAEKFITALTSFGKKDISEQLDTFAETLKQIPLEKRSLSKDESEALLKIFIAAAQPAFAKQFMGEVEKEVYFSFGTFLNEQLTKNETIQKLTHEYLNLFRFSSLLRRIYEEQKWEPLIHELILKSNYSARILFNQRLRDYKNKALFKVINGNTVTEYSWEKSANLVQNYRNAFYSLITKDTKVAFLLENCLEMALLDLACLTGGIVNVMIPGNSVTEHIRFILKQSKASVLITHNEKQLSKIKSLKNELPELKTVILLEGNSSEDWVINFEEFVKSGKEAQSEFEIGMNELATIMYTSGTTGEPKGIMFSQTNIVYKRFCRAMAIPEIGDEDRFISFLPLYHTFGRYLEMTGCVFWAAEYCFLENPSVEAMISNMQLVKPTVFISIPKKWMQLYEYITSKVDIEVDDHQKIKSELDKATGGELKWGLSAAGYLPPDIFMFFQKYGVELMSGFGMTEATGGITMTPWKRYKPNSLGKPLPGIEIKLGDDGEILVKGPYVMLGYYDTPNSETFIEDSSSELRSAGTGWLPTGDVMKMDEDGFIQIIDRKKEIYKNIKGETIAPQKIENLFRDFENVKQVFLVGDHRQFNTVLIHPNYDDMSSPLHDMDEKQKQEYFSSLIVTVNKFLSPFERILDFRLIDRPFDDQHGELTPKHTYKRKVIEKNFSELIDSMYVKNDTSVYAGTTEIKIPNWFLREKGCLGRDVVANEKGIAIPKLKLSLTLFKTEEKNIFRIGSFNYLISSHFIDFQQLLIDPLLWIGNHELTAFTGSSIIQWHRQIKESLQIRFNSVAGKTTLNEIERKQFNKIASSSEYSLQGIHLAYAMFLSDDINTSLDYFNKILDDPKNTHYRLVFNLLSRPATTSNIELKRKQFASIIKGADERKFGELFNLFIGEDKHLLNSELAYHIAVNSKGEKRLDTIEQFILNEVKQISKDDSLDQTNFVHFFELITAYGVTHPQLFRRIRRYLMRFAALEENAGIKKLADASLDALVVGFREWLGINQKIAVDLETSEEYTWEDVIAFEEGIDPDDRQRTKNAISKTAVLREAVFMFSKGFLIRLDDILPGGIWVSNLESRNDKSVYRITVQTRFQGSFDFSLHLNRNLPPAKVKEEIKWLILGGMNKKGERLLPHFGGYWEEYELWTEAFVPRDSVARFIEKENKKNDEEARQRLRELWPHFVWNTTSAYMNFWTVTNYKIQLSNPRPENITVPTHDYQTGTLLYSVSKRLNSVSPKDFFVNFHRLFIKDTLEKYSFLDKKSIWNYIFSGVTECEGEPKAIELIKKFAEEVKADSGIEDKDEILYRAEEFIKSVSNDGFIPKNLFFAIKRFHRWRALNRDADINAQAQMLYELYETYQLFDFEKEYITARPKFFLNTAFTASSDTIKSALSDIIRKQRSGEVNAEKSQQLYSELLSLPNLSEEEKFFLTRLNYPYLKPKDTAALIRSESFGADASNLVVQLTDEEGNPFMIRSPISPKEISKLHSLFLDSNLVVNFRPEHRFLVALSERGFIIGGLFYEMTDEQTVYMEKIVISTRYRRTGISENLMNEFLKRLKSEHIRYVTTGFFRPEYFYKFGFKVEKKYSGLVKEL
ncbi:MAG TPA: GNAT family N-acetyltransferase [Ignavibacteriaceae bacterium]|nr:GNAT family N-acetyltransferase [Ignavibacteriaceae bacterium]